MHEPISYVNPSHIFKFANDYIPEKIISNGRLVAEFEEKAAEYLGSKFAVATCSCTMALYCIWDMLGIAGKKVLMPSFTWRSTADAVRMAGGIPVFGDIDHKTFNLDIANCQGEEEFICLVDCFGCPADYDGFSKQPNKAGNMAQYVVDSAHSFGSLWHGEKIGKYGIHAFSFSPTKVLVSNEGGLITCNSEEIAKELKEIRRWAGRMTEFNAACALAGLKCLPQVLEKKNEIADRYRIFATENGWGIQNIPGGHYSTFKDVIFVLNSEAERDALKKHLEDAGIETKVYFVPVHTLEKYANAERKELKNTVSVYHCSLCVPSWPGIDQDYVIDTMKGFVRKTERKEVGYAGLGGN